MKEDSGLNGTLKFMVVCSFIMLSMLTWASSPLQKLVEKVQHKETIKAKLFVCSEIRASIPVYQKWTTDLWNSGCLWVMRDLLTINLNSKDQQGIIEQFKDHEGPHFEGALNHCSAASAAASKQHQIVDRVATPLYFERLACPEILKEAEKLGILEEIEGEHVQ